METEGEIEVLVANSEELGNLWLARLLLELGGVEFGDFTLGRTTVHSPIYINPRVLISQPQALQRIAGIMEQETRSGIARVRPRCAPYQVVAGVPLGGLHLATAFSLTANVPMIYARRETRRGKGHAIEGRFEEGQTVLVVDDLITTGGSVLATVEALQRVGLHVQDVIVLIDRDQGAAARLRRQALHLISLLPLKVMLNYYMASGLIEEEWYRKSLDYLGAHRAG